MDKGICRRTGLGAFLAVVMTTIMTTGPSIAQTTPATPPASNVPATPPPLPGAKAPPAVVAPDAKATRPSAATPPPTAPQTPTPSGERAGPPTAPPGPAVTPPAAEPKSSGDASSATTLTLEARPVAMLTGESDWDEGYKTITTSLQTIRDALAKANIKSVGNPQTVFRETNDNGFKFETMIPIDPAADTKTKLDSNVAFGHSPAGKALRFLHHGAYEEIDSTYEAITAYLDEKGFDTKNLFMEEYLNSAKSADDTDLQVYIYVLVK